MRKEDLKLGHFLIPLGGIVSLMPFTSPGAALFLGILLALAFENPYLNYSRQYTHKLLAISVVGLGAGMNLEVIGQAGMQGLSYTFIGILAILLIGMLLGKILTVKAKASLLITVGTAICGGSAIAAVAPAIDAKEHDISIALAIVFMLNAIALFIFPWIGNYWHLSQTQFGLWSALAIHDTSSVVGATMHYGKQALELGTTVKLARALWIVPLTLVIGYIYTKKYTADNAKRKIKFPWFILGFLITAAIVTWIPQLHSTGQIIQSIAKQLLVLTLFLIGTNLSRAALRAVGILPFLQGLILWVCVASASLGAIIIGWVH